MGQRPQGAPRLRIGVYEPARGVVKQNNAVSAGLALLARAGHGVEQFSDARRAAEYHAVAIAADFAELEGTIAEIAASIRRGQIVFHLGLAHGARVLENLEAAGAVVGAIYPATSDWWVLDAIDGVGEAVMTQLATDARVEISWLGEDERPAAMTQLYQWKVLDAAAKVTRLQARRALGLPPGRSVGAETDLRLAGKAAGRGDASGGAASEGTVGGGAASGGTVGGGLGRAQSGFASGDQELMAATRELAAAVEELTNTHPELAESLDRFACRVAGLFPELGEGSCKRR